MTIRPLTIEDLLAFWQMDRVPATVRGFAVEREGQVVAVTGLMYVRAFILAFAEFPPDVQRYPVTVMKVARRMVELMRTVRAPIYASADKTLPGSGNFLEHLGFVHVQERQYQWSNA